MLTPLLLNLYNAAVRSLPENRKAQEREIAEGLDAAYKTATGRLDKLVNALEKKDEQAIREALQTSTGGATFTPEQAAFFDAIQEQVFPAPEYVAQSPIVTDGNLSQLMESLPPAFLVPAGADLTPSDLVPGAISLEVPSLPPQSPPASVPVPAVAEPSPAPVDIPAPAVTPGRSPRADTSAKPPKSSRGR